MFRITSLTNNPKQEFTVLLNNADTLTLNFEYKPNQLGWFFGFTYNNETYSNIRLTTSYNVLRAYRNWLPFGLRCDTIDNEEPMGLDDFTSEYAQIYIIPKEELDAIEGLYYGKI